MRFLRELFYITVAVLLATAGYAVPIVALLLSAVVPDAEWLVIEQAPEREVGLALDPGLLDDAFLRDERGDPPQEPDPGEDKEEPEPVVVPPPKKVVEEKEVEEPVAEAALPDDLPENPNARPRVQHRSAAEARAERLAKLAAERGAKKKGGGKGSKKQKCADPVPGVSETGPNEFSIERDLVMRYASDLDAAAKLASVAWAHNEKGKVVGFSVKRIRCGTLLDLAGLENGDVIHEVNGKPVRSVVQAFGAWRKVKKKDVVRIQLSRKGKRMQLEYHIL